jgi:hypothetical protein
MDHDRRRGVAAATAVLAAAVVLMAGAHALAGSAPGLGAAVALIFAGLAVAGRLGRAHR